MVFDLKIESGLDEWFWLMIVGILLFGEIVKNFGLNCLFFCRLIVCIV